MDKVLVLMTDGNNEWYDCPEGAPGACRTTGSSPPCRSTYRSDGDADMTAYGRLRENRLGLASVTNANALAEINARMSRLCTSIKATGVILYTITFNVTNSTTRDLYRACATQPEYYFNSPDATALQAAFREIAGQLANFAWPTEVLAPGRAARYGAATVPREHKVNRRHVMTIAAAALAAPRLSFAQDNWPNRPVTSLVPFAAGGSNDVVARFIAPALEQKFGQPFIIDNRPGGGGSLGMGMVARGRADGQTLPDLVGLQPCVPSARHR